MKHAQANTTRYGPWLVQLCLVVWLIVPASVLARQTLVLNTAFTAPLSNDQNTGFVDIVVREALARIGYDLETVRLPAERALINANAGIDDGDLLRIAGLQGIYPNLVQVPERIIGLEFVVFTRQEELRVDDWEDLAPLSVAIITGWKILERSIPDSTHLTTVKNVDQLFTLLARDRVDAVVYSRRVGLGYLARHDIRRVRLLEPPLNRRDMYVYLHRKHQHLVPKLAAALRAMKADGSYQRAYQRILAPLDRR